MAKKPGRERVYEAASRWVDAALRNDDSLFTPGDAYLVPDESRGLL